MGTDPPGEHDDNILLIVVRKTAVHLELKAPRKEA
jgi:hypothetical protein